MSNFAVNISTIFTDIPFLERFKKARDSGFSFIECQFPYAFSIEDIQHELLQHELSMVLINLPPGNWEEGDRGIAADPKRVEEFRQSVQDGIKYAKALNVSRIHCMAGIVSSEMDTEEARRVYIENLRYAGAELAKQDMTLFIEPINTYDMPGYFLNDIHLAKGILGIVGLPNVKLQFDFYHMERIYGDSLSVYQQFAGIVGHVQIADVPGRHEPGTGIMDYQKIATYLNKTHQGYIGLEYTPLGDSKDSFEWLRQVVEGGE